MGWFFSTCAAIPLFDRGVHPEGLFYCGGQKIAKYFMLGGLNGTDLNKI